MTVHIGGIGQVAVFVKEPSAAARFWADALGAPQPDADGGTLVELGFTEIFFHPVDREKTSTGEEKNPWGSSTVVYLAVDDLDEMRARLLARGCDPWRGPIEIEDGRRICQVSDPFGTVWGLDGP